jgi:hypothetical protein
MTIADLARRSLILCVLCAIATLTLHARAGDKAQAESLFREGKKLLAAGKLSEACAKFAASQEQDPAPGTLLNLGKCHEGLGKHATAWNEYKQAEALARDMGRAEQEALALERVKAVEPKLSRLRVNPPRPSPDGLVVKRDGERIAESSLGQAVPVDAGSFTIEASAPGYEVWRQQVEVGPDADQKSVQVPALSPIRRTEAAPRPSAATSQDVAADTGSSSKRTIGWALIGVGGAAVVVGGVLGFMVIQQANDAEDDPSLCPNKTCTAEGRKEIDSAETKATISTIAVGVGFVAVGAGLYLLMTSGKPPTESTRTTHRVKVVPTSLRSGAGLAVEGVF